MFPWILCAILVMIIAALLLKLRLIQKSMDEIRAEFRERLSTDTNTLITVSSGDKRIRRLAAEINCQLRILRQQRKQYLNGDRELKEAVANISHDLRTPLTAICGYLDLLDKEEKSEDAERYITCIENRTQAMARLTEELFQYTILLSANTLELEDVVINDVLEESLIAFYAALTEKKITPEIILAEKKIKRHINQAALSRIFGNILTNVLKYSAGDLGVKLLENGEILFSNTVCGLDEVQVGKLFNRFFTVETARNSTGLGLSIAKTLTEQMGGTITARYTNHILTLSVYFREE